MGTLPDMKEKVGREEAEVAGVAHSLGNLPGQRGAWAGGGWGGGKLAVRPRKGPDVCLLLHIQNPNPCQSGQA